MNKHTKDQDASSRQIVFLKGKKTVLRPISEHDIPLFLRWFNDPDVRPYLMTIFPVTEGKERDWIENMNKKSETEVVLMIEAKGVPIGTMGIHAIDWRSGVGTTGAAIGEKQYWDKGYGTDAKMALLDYAFNTLNLRKIMTRVKAFNKRSIAYSLHCGYKVEGRLKEQVFAHGCYWDEVILGLFKKDWLPYWEKYVKK